MRVILKIRGNEGYNAQQVADEHELTTVGELRRWLEEYDDETPIVTDNLNNQYGANFGLVQGMDEDYSDEEEE